MSRQDQGTGEQPIADPAILLSLRTFRQPAWRALVQIGLFFTIAAAGLSLALGKPPKPEVGWPLAAFGVVLGIVVPWLTTFGGRRRVELFEDGFVVHGLFRTRRWRWTEVSDFTLATTLPGRGMRQTYVVFDAAGDRGALIRMHKFLSGRGHSLPIGLEPPEFPGNAVTVALTMNAWRERALDNNAMADS